MEKAVEVAGGVDEDTEDVVVDAGEGGDAVVPRLATIVAR